MTPALLAAAFLAISIPSAAPPPAAAGARCTVPPLRPGPPPWRSGEQLSFDVDVMGIVKAGTIHAAVDAPMFRGTQIPLRARARSTSVFAKVKRARAQAMSWVDARTLRPQRYRDESEENGTKRTTDVRLDRGGDHVALEWTLNEKRGTREFERQGEVLDLVSTVYFLRAAELAPGKAFCFDLVANRRYWRLEGALAAGTERVETPLGPFETIRFDAKLTRLATPDDPNVRTRPLHLWFSSDDRRVPVAAVTEVDLGPVRALIATGASPRSAAKR
jgi:hypothetical protein